jgi:AcrR family transcriptional regulator
VAAAVKVFYARGYSDATVQDVADELGILKGSLYHYIDKKEDLLFSLFEQVHGDVEEIMRRVAAAAGLDPVQRLALYVRLQVLHNLADLERITIYYRELDRLADARRGAVITWRHVHEDFIANLIAEGQALGLVDPAAEAKLLAGCVFATVIWPYRWFRPGGDIPAADVAESCVAFALAGVVGGSGNA